MYDVIVNIKIISYFIKIFNNKFALCDGLYTTPTLIVFSCILADKQILVIDELKTESLDLQRIYLKQLLMYVDIPPQVSLIWSIYILRSSMQQPTVIHAAEGEHIGWYGIGPKWNLLQNFLALPYPDD